MTEQSKGFIANNWFKLSIVVFLFCLLIIYIWRQADMGACIDNAADIYHSEWVFRCKEEKKPENCTHPRYFADMLEKDRQARVDQCIKRYSFR